MDRRRRPVFGTIRLIVAAVRSLELMDLLDHLIKTNAPSAIKSVSSATFRMLNDQLNVAL